MFLVLFLLIIAGYFFLLTKKILMPFIFSALFAYILNPIVSYIESFGIKRAFAVTLLYLIIIIMLIILINFIFPLLANEIINFKEHLPYYANQTKNYIILTKNYIISRPFLKQQGGLVLFTEEIFPKFAQFLTANISKAPKHIFNILSTVSLMLLIPFISFFMLINGKKFIKTVFNTIPSKYVETSLSLICEIDVVIGKYIRGQLLDAASVGILSTIGLLILNVDHAPLLGTLAGIGNLIPYLGPIVGGVPAAIITLFKTKSLFAVIKVVLMFMTVQFVDNNFITPFVVGKTVELHPIAILFALLVGGQFFGPIGMLFAVPTLCIFKITISILFKHFTKQQS
ncbi:MAG: AI-2E family transporter [Elusimicrobiota bacterium]